ncbi:LrgB family protein [Bacillus sp. 2205SS5-2]|uniref:LrgB family protein n=1 Tax=Bacillus sp. 2205SS5-2 TaxID=3109031 RepID=UPI003007A39A
MANLLMTIFTLCLTVLAYWLSIELAKKYRYPFTTPLFLSTLIIIGLFMVMDISYQDYSTANTLLTYLLGPATVALALPIYKNRKIIITYFRPALVGILVGSLVTISSAIFLAHILHLGNEIELSLSLKSITTPVAVEVAEVIGANISLSAAFVVVTGILGAMFGPWLLTKAKVIHPVSRGLALGVISHGIGTSEAVKEGQLEGAVAGSAMGVTSLLLSLVLPMLL